jgi:hypothetical protein
MDLITKTAFAQTDALNQTASLPGPLDTKTRTTGVLASPDSVLSGLPSRDSLSETLGKRLVIIDKSVKDWQSLAQGAIDGSDVYILDSARDGMAQIGEILGGYDQVKSLHIVSHGTAGAFTLSGRTVDAGNLGRNQVSMWKGHLSNDADILLYGCNIAADASGLAFLQTLGELTGADIAASTDLTGAAAAGGNWVLEANYGQIESNLAFTEAARNAYLGILPNPNILFNNFTDVTQIALNGDAAQAAGALRLTPAQTFKGLTLQPTLHSRASSNSN